MFKNAFQVSRSVKSLPLSSEATPTLRAKRALRSCENLAMAAIFPRSNVQWKSQVVFVAQIAAKFTITALLVEQGRLRPYADETRRFGDTDNFNRMKASPLRAVGNAAVLTRRLGWGMIQGLQNPNPKSEQRRIPQPSGKASFLQLKTMMKA